MEDLQKNMADRKIWFFETQLRRLNLGCFQSVSSSADALYHLITEKGVGMSLLNGLIPSPTAKDVYIDSQQPFWNQDEQARRGALAAEYIGRLCNWLNYVQPNRLIQKLSDIQNLWSQIPFGSEVGLHPVPIPYTRKGAVKISDTDPINGDQLSQAICRASLAASRPWLIPELYFATPVSLDLEGWVKNGEDFINRYENEISIAVNGTFNEAPADSFDAGAYTKWLQDLLKKAGADDLISPLQVNFLTAPNSANNNKYVYKVAWTVPGLSDADVQALPGVKYWMAATEGPLREAYMNKVNSDMGLCALIRVLYLFGTLPDSLGPDEKITWRKRLAPDENFGAFFAERKKEIDSATDDDLSSRFEIFQSKLEIILEQSAAFPKASAPEFSILSQEIIKQAILNIKFWIDEPFRVMDYDAVKNAKTDLGMDGVDAEMEYWSENHYIMFASNEYLAGQFFSRADFQPAKFFLKAGDSKGILKGAKRRERAHARVMKYLNNRLQFGWGEFNSSGYYEEHSWAIFNLVDFAMDDDIRNKAKIVLDLLLFDIFRYQHRGTMGAAGGRCQYKFKSSGWDNAVGDMVEIALGTRGLYLDADSSLGSFIATSSYTVPDVLLEIGCHPPSTGFTDRSRVSVSFDEAGKYGITYSQKSKDQDSILQGFASKRTRYSAFVDLVNQAIADNHSDYGATEDDTVFWWTLSGFFHVQTVRATFRCVDKFSLNNSPIFKTFALVLKYLVPILEVADDVTIGSLVAALPRDVIDLFTDENGLDFEQRGADDLSVLLEGSTRTRANILSYRNGGAMLSSIQNFRVGQLNFQSSVLIASLNTTVSVFPTVDFAGFDISSASAGIFGAVIGGIVGFYTGGIAAEGIGEIVGATGAIVANKDLLSGQNFLGDDDDGPGWWSGYWSLPLIAQHESAAIVMVDFHAIQKFLAKTGSHVWFPKPGFTKTDEVRTSAYDDENFFLADITNIGPKGFWLFGKILHQKGKDESENEEGYIGVFSNQRPDWNDQHTDFYDRKIDGFAGDKKDPLWKKPLATDYFADHDWYSDGKNVWIIQIGSKQEFGDYENFKQRVSSAKVSIDDEGDMECKYEIPKPDGSSQTLSIKYGDGGQFELDGQPYQTDLFPRFENPYVRGGRVEWGQREYVIEYNNKNLLHDFHDYSQPVRTENFQAEAETLLTIRALVIFIRTEDEDMDVFTVANATVENGCDTATTDQTVAAGPVNENTTHDAEWIFFDESLKLSTDLILQIEHPASTTGDHEPHWKMSFTMKALMGDRTLIDCSPSFSYFDFDGAKRNTGSISFSVTRLSWNPWNLLIPKKQIDFWIMTEQPGYNPYYLDSVTFIGVDRSNRLLFARQQPCMANANTSWIPINQSGSQPDFSQPYSCASRTTMPGNAMILVLNAGQVFASWFLSPGNWNPAWVTIPLQIFPDGLFGLPDETKSPVVFKLAPLNRLITRVSTFSQDGMDIYLSADDGNLYNYPDWRPGGIGIWRKISVSGFTMLYGSAFDQSGDFLVALGSDLMIYATTIDHSGRHLTPVWEKITTGFSAVASFKIFSAGSDCQILLINVRGEIWAGDYTPGIPVNWHLLHQQGDFRVSPDSPIACIVPFSNHLQFFVAGMDGNIYTYIRENLTGWIEGLAWQVVSGDAKPYMADPSGNIFALNRVNGQVELYADDAEKNIYKSWWS